MLHKFSFTHNPLQHKTLNYELLSIPLYKKVCIIIWEKCAAYSMFMIYYASVPPNTARRSSVQCVDHKTKHRVGPVCDMEGRCPKKVTRFFSSSLSLKNNASNGYTPDLVDQPTICQSDLVGKPTCQSIESVTIRREHRAGACADEKSFKNSNSDLKNVHTQKMRVIHIKTKNVNKLETALQQKMFHYKTLCLCMSSPGHSDWNWPQKGKRM